MKKVWTYLAKRGEEIDFSLGLEAAQAQAADGIVVLFLLVLTLCSPS